MKEFVGLSSRDMEHLMVTIETSLKVNNRHQFFLWSQGALQGFIPHETLLCAYGDIARMRFKHESFSRGLLNTQAELEVGDLVKGLLPRLVDDWLRGGGVPRLSNPDAHGQVGRRALLADLKRFNFGHVLAHGAREMQGEFGSFFVFVDMPKPPGAQDAYLLEVLMPYLHMALHRVLGHEANGKAAEPVVTNLLSKREIQVLHWVKNGKTNHEIAQILDISPPTVKNHLQKVMRKLNVTNRAQAVGKAEALRLFAPGNLV